MTANGTPGAAAVALPARALYEQVQAIALYAFAGALLRHTDVAGLVFDGIAIALRLKIEDGNSRASEAVITALLTRIGVLDPGHPATDTAISNSCQLLLTHHPLIFKPLKRISTADATGAIVQQAKKKERDDKHQPHERR